MDEALSTLTSLQSTLANISGSAGASSKDATSLNREISAVNSTHLSSVESQTDQLVAATDALDARRSTADGAVRAAAADARLLLDRLARLLTQLAAMTPGVDGGGTAAAAAIAQLSDDIRRTRDDVNSRAWNSEAQRMRSTLAEYQQQIASLIQRRDDLAGQLAAMTRLLAQFT